MKKLLRALAVRIHAAMHRPDPPPERPRRTRKVAYINGLVVPFR